MKSKKRFVNVVFDVSMFFTILFSIFFVLLFGKPFYSLEYNIHKNEILFSNLSRIEYVNHTMQIVDYFFDNNKFIIMRDLNGNVIKNYFTNEEILHMVDVKHLVRIVTFIFSVSLFLFLLLMKFAERRKVMRVTSLISLIFIGVLFLLSISDFSDAFIMFHKILFTNNFWLLPDNTKLIEMFPESFFYDFAKIWFITFALINGLIYLFTTFTAYFFPARLSSS
jgi:integral membrane protein (TIGR01906 family)